MARSALIEALRRLERGIVEYENLVNRIDDAASSLAAERNFNASQIEIRKNQVNQIINLNDHISEERSSILAWRMIAETARIATEFATDALPTVLGFATDALSAQRAALRAYGRTFLVAPPETVLAIKESSIQDSQDEKNEAAALAELQLFTSQAEFNDQERLRQLEQLVRGEPAARLELVALAESQKRLRVGLRMPGVIVVPKQLGIGLAIADLQVVLACGTDADLENAILFLPLRASAHE